MTSPKFWSMGGGGGAQTAHSWIRHCYISYGLGSASWLKSIDIVCAREGRDDVNIMSIFGFYYTVLFASVLDI